MILVSNYLEMLIRSRHGNGTLDGEKVTEGVRHRDRGNQWLRLYDVRSMFTCARE